MNENVITLSRFRADLATKSGSARKRELFNAPDPQVAIQALHPTELVQLAHELGLADAIDLLAMAAPEQIRALVFLRAFKDDLPDLPALDEIFHAALSHGHGTASRIFHALDEELQTFYVAQRLHIWQTHDEEPPDDFVDLYRTPDGTFIISPRDEAGESGKAIVGVILDLYAFDWREADTILRDAKHTLLAELEDAMSRLRGIELSELGFPSREDAVHLFAKPLETAALEKRVRLGAEHRPLPARYAESFINESLLSDAFALIHDEQLLADLEAELVRLTNTVLIADNAEAGDVEAVRPAARDVRAMLSLGLELLAGEDAHEAAALIAAHPLRAIFRHGYAQVYRLKNWAERARKEGLFRLPELPDDRSLLAIEETEFLTALTRLVPRYVEAPHAEPHAFGSKEELLKARAVLEKITGRIIALKWLLSGRKLEDVFAGGSPAPTEAGWRPILRSLLVAHALQEKPENAAVSHAMLARFTERFAADAVCPLRHPPSCSPRSKKSGELCSLMCARQAPMPSRSFSI